MYEKVKLRAWIRTVRTIVRMGVNYVKLVRRQMWERLKWPRVEYWCKNCWEKMFIKHTRVDIRTVPKSPDMIIQVINNCNVKTWGASDLFKLIEKWGKKFKIYARQWKEMIKKVGRLELVVSKSKKLRSKHYSESLGMVEIQRLPGVEIGLTLTDITTKHILWGDFNNIKIKEKIYFYVCGYPKRWHPLPCWGFRLGTTFVLCKSRECSGPMIDFCRPSFVN